MKIIYVAKHDGSGNDDEGAIVHAMEVLGHHVVCIPEHSAADLLKQRQILSRADLLLFHKWDDVLNLQRFRGICPRAFWYFDQVMNDDTSLRKRVVLRLNWMDRVMPNVDFGFCTDGQWVKKYPQKLTWLMQGADERIVGKGEPSEEVDILFTGIARGGYERYKFVHEMVLRYGPRFRHIVSGVYREPLRDLIAGAKIVVCPPAPITNHYWSNRVFNAAGFGAFILHPYTDGVLDFYHANKEVCYYHSMSDLQNSINWFLDKPEKRREVSTAALERTCKDHLYQHRLVVLLEKVKQGTTYAPA